MHFGSLQLTTNFSQIIEYFFSYSHLHKLGVSLAIFLAFLLFKNIFTRYIFNFLMRICNRTKVNADEYFLTAFRGPFKSLILVIGAYLALKTYTSGTYNNFLNHLLSSAIVISVACGFHKLTGLYAANEEEINRLLNARVDRILIPFFSKMIRFIIIALAFVVIASDWGYDVNGFIAGLGLGGLAFALAAKDLLANVFSGIVIVTDKPFSIGDWVKTDDVEGTIEDINFRSTKIRRFDEALVTVPNSNLVNAPIINFTKRAMRRVNFNLGVRYDTPKEKLQKCIERIEKLLIEHPDVDNQTIFVKFDSFGDSALNIFLYFFTNTIIWKEYLGVKQDINFKIMAILEEEGVEIAFPSTSVYVEKMLDFTNDS